MKSSEFAVETLLLDCLSCQYLLVGDCKYREIKEGVGGAGEVF